MKKSLVALATLAAATGAFAQSPNARAGAGSNVEIFGIVDMAINKMSVPGAGGSITQLEGSGRNESTRLGFRGVEDMGGGWAAAFWIEAGFNADNGTGGNTTINNTVAGDKFTFATTGPATASNSGSTATVAGSLNGRQGLTFNRASTVSLIGKGIGEIRLGRDYNPTFWNMTGFDPFGTVGVGAATNVILGAVSLNSQISSNPVPSVRTSNAVTWLSESINGFRGQVMYAFSEMPSGCVTPLVNNNNGTAGLNSNYCGGASGDGKAQAYRLRYEQGPLNIAYAWSQATYGDVAAGTSGTSIATATGTTAGVLATNSATRTNLTTQSVAGSYTMGALRLMAQIGSQKSPDSAAVTTSTGRVFNYNLIGATYTSGALTYKVAITNGKRSETVAPAPAVANTSESGTKQTQTAVGLVYDLSKRTALYGTYSQLKYTAGPNSAGNGRNTMGLADDVTTANNSRTAKGIDLGVRHRF